MPLGDVTAKDDDCICSIEKMAHIAMPKWTQAMRGAHLPEIVLGNKVVIGLAYVAGYVLLDRISFVEPYASFGITPWNPNTGLSFAFVLIFGLRMIPLLFVSAFMADLVNRQIGVPWAVEAIWVALIGGGYSTALAYLKRSRTRFDPALSSMRDLVLLILVAAASAAFVASTYVGVAIAAGLLSIKDFAPATLRYWIGDAVGILALTPLALFVLTRRRILPLSVETALQFAAIAAALLAVFGFSQEREFQLFYLLFLPIVWMAVRNGTEGVSAGILITQFGLILGVGLFPDERNSIGHAPTGRGTISFRSKFLSYSREGLARRFRIGHAPTGRGTISFRRKFLSYSREGLARRVISPPGLRTSTLRISTYQRTIGHAPTGRGTISFRSKFLSYSREGLARRVPQSATHPPGGGPFLFAANFYPIRGRGSPGGLYRRRGCVLRHSAFRHISVPRQQSLRVNFEYQSPWGRDEGSFRTEKAHSEVGLAVMFEIVSLRL